MDADIAQHLLAISSVQAATNQKLTDLVEQLVGGPGREGAVSTLYRQQAETTKDLDARTQNLAQALETRTQTLAKDLELRTQTLANEMEMRTQTLAKDLERRTEAMTLSLGLRNEKVDGALESLRTKAAVTAWKLGTSSAAAGAGLSWLTHWIFRVKG